MKKYMNLLTKKVEVEIANIVPEDFAIFFDGWSNGSTHYGHCLYHILIMPVKMSTVLH